MAKVNLGMIHLNIPSYLPPFYSSPIPVVARIGELDVDFMGDAGRLLVTIHPDAASTDNTPLQSVWFSLGQLMNPAANDPNLNIPPVRLYTLDGLAAAVSVYQTNNPGVPALTAIVMCLLDNVGGVQTYPLFAGSTLVTS